MDESIILYGKARELVNKLRGVDNIILNANLDALIDVDMNLFELWKNFEKDALGTVEKVNDGAISGIRLPTIFGFPEIIYYHNGIIAFRTFKGHVIALVSNRYGAKKLKHFVHLLANLVI